MFTRKTFALAGLVLAIAVISPATAQAATGGTDRPFKFSETGTGVTNLATGQVSIALTGHGTHFGQYQHTEQGQGTPAGPGVMNYSSTWHVVAANGDDVFGQCAGTGTTSDGIHFLILLDCISTGGTGRFAGANGTFGAVVSVTYVSVEGSTAYSEVEAAGVGTISY